MDRQVSVVAAYAKPPPVRRETDVRIVVPGEVICDEAGFLRGHGTYIRDGKLIATVAGVVDRVNKLVSVHALRARYTGDIGDVVVGRVVEVGFKRWAVDVQSRQHAVLMLSSINMPGGVQRRRSAADELQMRQFFVEGDVISAEVQQHFGDGGVSLATRNRRYGKLQNGVLVKVVPTLVRRCTSHFHTFPCGVMGIFGRNGYIWLAPARADAAGAADGSDMNAIVLDEDNSHAFQPVPAATREAIARLQNAVNLLAKSFVAIDPDTVWEVYQASLDLAPAAMLAPSAVEELAARARDASWAAHELGGGFGERAGAEGAGAAAPMQMNDGDEDI